MVPVRTWDKDCPREPHRTGRRGCRYSRRDSTTRIRQGPLTGTQPSQRRAHSSPAPSSRPPPRSPHRPDHEVDDESGAGQQQYGQGALGHGLALLGRHRHLRQPPAATPRRAARCLRGLRGDEGAAEDSHRGLSAARRQHQPRQQPRRRRPHTARSPHQRTPFSAAAGRGLSAAGPRRPAPEPEVPVARWPPPLPARSRDSQRAGRMGREWGCVSSLSVGSPKGEPWKLSKRVSLVIKTLDQENECDWAGCKQSP